MRNPGGGQDIGEVLRSLGEEGLVREAEAADLKPKRRRMFCPFEGCRGKTPEDSVTMYAGKRGEWRVKCWRCSADGSLVDVIAAVRGITTQQAIAHLHSTASSMPPPKARLHVVPKADDPEKLTPVQVKALWDSMAAKDAIGEEYLASRGLADAVDLGLVRFATETHSDQRIQRQAVRGYRIAVLLSNVVGEPRGIQLRMAGEPEDKETTKIMSVKGSSLGRAFFGSPGLIEASPLVCVTEGLADTLAASIWAAKSGVVIAGAAGKDNLHRLGEELEAAGIEVEGKLFGLFAQNDRPRNHSRRAFVRLSQVLSKRGARPFFIATDAQFKDLAAWRQTHQDVEWPPKEVRRATVRSPEDDAGPEDRISIAPGTAVPLPDRVQVDVFGQNYDTLCSLFDDPAHSEPILGPGELTFDEMTTRVRVGGREIQETDLSTIRLNIERNARTPEGKRLRFGVEDISSALQMLARRKPVHPVREWLRSLKWDGTERLETELPAALGHGEQSFACVLLSKWMVAAAMRPLEPGCKVDSILVLVGGQGIGKSTFFSVLAGGSPWFVDSPVDIEDVNGKMIMREAWIVEWAELDSMRRARDQDAIKSFLSSQVDVFRAPYGRGLSRAPRGCVIAGTTNNKEFLHDPTGNRRFWPVEVTKVDTKWVRAHRDQLMAEAVVRCEAWVAAGRPEDEKPWVLSPDEAAFLATANEEHEARDVWTDPVERWLDANRLLDQVSASDVLDGAIGKKTDAWSDVDSRRVVRILRSFGWSGPFRRGRRRERVYVRPKE